MQANGIGGRRRTCVGEMREASLVGSGIKRCTRLDANFKVLAENSGQGHPHPTSEGSTRTEAPRDCSRGSEIPRMDPTLGGRLLSRDRLRRQSLQIFESCGGGPTAAERLQLEAQVSPLFCMTRATLSHLSIHLVRHCLARTGE